jgi:CTP:molybdopterin cytidylyltransferase MocA
MLNLQTILADVNAGPGPAVLATRVEGPDAGTRLLGHGLPAEDVLATGGCRLAQDGGGALLLERLVPRKLPPWLNFGAQVLDKGKSCVLVTVCAVGGDVPFALGDHFAYDERNHGLLPMDGKVSLELQRLCEAARLDGVPCRRNLAVAGGRLEVLLEPLSPAVVPTVILAAGASRRLGSPKQLVVLEGETLLRRIARTALAGGGPVTVVTGCRAADMAATLEGLPVRVLENPGWEEGMASSIRAGAAALPPDASGVLLLLCDQPAVNPGLLARLQAAHRAEPQAVVACAYGGTAGVPTLIPARHFPRLLALRGDQGARGLLREEGAVLIPFPEGEADVDGPEALLGPLFDGPGRQPS